MSKGNIFISYRRDDARGASGRLYDWMRIAFGSDRVFRDVNNIAVGKWRDRIDCALSRSTVCLAGMLRNQLRIIHLAHLQLTP